MIDPAAAAVLEKLQAGAAPMPADQAEWLAGYRASVDGFVQFQGEAPDVAVENAHCDGLRGPIALRVYGGAADPDRPVALFCHGGGFVAGSLDGYDVPLRHLALRSGCRIVAVDYALAPEHVFPAALDDCLAALDHVADGARIAVVGDSAGGLLAAVLARRARAAGIEIALQVLLYPNTDLREHAGYASRKEFDGTLIRVDELTRSLALYAAGHDRDDPDLSPVLAPELAGLCAAYVVTNELDPLRDEGELYARRLAAAGVAVTHQRAPGMIHASFQMAAAIPAGDALITRIADRLRWA